MVFSSVEPEMGSEERADLAAADSFHILEEIIESCGEVPAYIPFTRSEERLERLSAARSAAR